MATPRATGLLTLFLVAWTTGTHAQSQTSVFEFLKLPESAHIAAMGGIQAAITRDDPSMMSSNPALASYTSGRSVTLGYMNYLSDTHVASARYNDKIRQRSTLSLSARFVDYGRTDMTAEDGTVQGTFTSKDMAFNGTYSYMLAEELSGGVTARIIYSHYGTYTSIAVTTDLGLCYTPSGNGFTLAAAVLNLGGQVKAFENTTEKVPTDLIAGISYRLEHAPVKFAVTMHNLNHWDSDYYYHTEDLNFGQILARHVILGADIDITDQIFVAAGCNMQSRAELADNGGRGLEGFSLGAGLNLNRMALALSYGKYQVSASSLMLNFTFAF